MNALSRYRDKQQERAFGFADGMMILVKLSMLTLATEFGFGPKRLIRFTDAFGRIWSEMNAKTQGFDKLGHKIKNDAREIYDEYLDVQIEKCTKMKFYTDADGRLYFGKKEDAAALEEDGKNGMLVERAGKG